MYVSSALCCLPQIPTLTITSFNIGADQFEFVAKIPNNYGAIGTGFDVFHTENLSSNNWKYLQRVPILNNAPCGCSVPFEIPFSAITHTDLCNEIPNQGFFYLGTLHDSDDDGLPDAYEMLVSKTDRFDPLDSTEDFDEDGLINLHEYWSATDCRVADADPIENALANAALAIDSRIVGKNPVDALPMFLNYLANGQTNTFIRNPQSWASDIDLTCCSVWNSADKNKRAGTLISPRHVLFVAHYPIGAGTVMTFVDKNNNVVIRTITATKRHTDYGLYDYPYYPDIVIGLLDSDVPTNTISFAYVLPDDYYLYIKTGMRLPCIKLNQFEEAAVGEIEDVSYEEDSMHFAIVSLPLISKRIPFSKNVIQYDSGNPTFLVLNDTPVLLTLWTGVDPISGTAIGTSIVSLKDDINTLMAQLDPTYQLTEIDLSSFTPL